MNDFNFLDKMGINILRIRVFRAIDDLESCNKFAYGHMQILKSYGVPVVSSAKTDWFYNPGVYVLIIETLRDHIVIGGVKIHIANDNYALPIENALGEQYPCVYDLVKQETENGTGELCGLWNSIEAAGKGYSTLLMQAGVAQAGIAVASQLNLKSLFALASPWTLATTLKLGFSIEKSIGNNGFLPYPTADLLATLLIVKDIKKLELADSIYKERINDLRNNPQQKKQETGPKGTIDIEYDLIIPNTAK